MQSPRVAHWEAALRVVRYLKLKGVQAKEDFDQLLARWTSLLTVIRIGQVDLYIIYK